MCMQYTLALILVLEFYYCCGHVSGRDMLPHLCIMQRSESSIAHDILVSENMPQIIDPCPATRRKKFVGILREKFAHLNLVYSIGGQISFDVFPQVSSCCPSHHRFLKLSARHLRELLLTYLRSASVMAGVVGNIPARALYHERACSTMAALGTVCTYISACHAGLGQDILLAVCGGRWLQ